MRIKFDKDLEKNTFVGRKVRCPMCGRWIIRSRYLFRPLVVLCGQLDCGKCGTKITFNAEGKVNE